ncbi:hypothetical protein WUBG_00344 [Wuchereria bancrofti]|uniref:Uncharacterized protein n=1 Tax=Wuchereria bancrofti TaxID=6293 RepID=J9FMY6_WUCBA|nr:hypothetical protein WUBG_00344 [Wuchereria bancrofti]
MGTHIFLKVTARKFAIPVIGAFRKNMHLQCNLRGPKACPDYPCSVSGLTGLQVSYEAYRFAKARIRYSRKDELRCPMRKRVLNF